MLVAMITVYYAQGKGPYFWQRSTIPYISDIGASFLQPLFIAGCSVTSACFVASLSIERLLRHHGRLHADLRRREKAFSWLAILGAVIGAVGLITLACRNDRDHKTEHDIFLLVFIVGVALSAIFTIVEFRWISKNYHWVRKVRRAYVAKAFIAGILILAAIGYAICFKFARGGGGAFRFPCPYLRVRTDVCYVAAIIEWIIAFGFTFYLLTFVWDLRMAKGVRAGELKRERLLAMQEQGQGGEAMRETNAAGGGGIFGRLRGGPPSTRPSRHRGY